MNLEAVTIRLAQESERAALEDLQRRSSMHQPVYRAQLEAQPDAIELPTEQITAGLVRVADGLFVEPERMRAGVGRRLIEDAKLIARERGAARIDVVANPQAIAFYEAVGFMRVGEAQTRFGPAPRMSLVVSA
jgi:GNAT superfamily N-acetyltransferase